MEENKNKLKRGIIIGAILSVILIGIVVIIINVNNKRELQEKINGLELPQEEIKNDVPPSVLQTQEEG